MIITGRDRKKEKKKKKEEEENNNNNKKKQTKKWGTGAVQDKPFDEPETLHYLL